MDSNYVFREQAEVDERPPHKESVLGQFTTKLKKSGAHAFEDFRERELKLLLRWSEYNELTNLLNMKDNAGSPQSVAFFAGRQSAFEEVSKAAVAIMDDKAAAKKKEEESEDE